MFAAGVGTAFVDLTWDRIYTYDKSFEIGTCLFITREFDCPEVWPCMVWQDVKIQLLITLCPEVWPCMVWQDVKIQLLTTLCPELWPCMVWQDVKIQLLTTPNPQPSLPAPTPPHPAPLKTPTHLAFPHNHGSQGQELLLHLPDHFLGVGQGGQTHLEALAVGHELALVVAQHARVQRDQFHVAAGGGVEAAPDLLPVARARLHHALVDGHADVSHTLLQFLWGAALKKQQLLVNLCWFLLLVVTEHSCCL